MYRSLLVSSIALAWFACGNDSAPLAGDPNGSGASTGLPCDVEQVIGSLCQGCHGSPLAGNAPIRLVTYDDLVRTSNGMTIAQRAIVRMTDTVKPMPPPPSAPATSADVQVLQSWIAAGMPKGDCAGGTGPFDMPAICSSGRTWTGGTQESPAMQPGAACNACHKTSSEAPQFTVSGTVYATGHEPTECYGAPGGASVEITDAANVTHSLTVNSAGNFYYQGPIQFPISAKVVSPNGTRVMIAKQSNGDCNSCHTQNGTMMAPGRIALP